MTRPTIHVADWGEFHATRHRAQEIAIAIVAAGATIVDFTGVQAVAGGFADELRTHLPEGAELVGMNAEVAETFADVTSRRGQQAPS